MSKKRTKDSKSPSPKPGTATPSPIIAALSGYDPATRSVMIPSRPASPTKPTSGSWLGDARTLLEMGASQIDAATVRGLIAELHTGQASLEDVEDARITYLMTADAFEEWMRTGNGGPFPLVAGIEPIVELGWIRGAVGAQNDETTYDAVKRNQVEIAKLRAEPALEACPKCAEVENLRAELVAAHPLQGATAPKTFEGTVHVGTLDLNRSKPPSEDLADLETFRELARGYLRPPVYEHDLAALLARVDGEAEERGRLKAAAVRTPRGGYTLDEYWNAPSGKGFLGAEWKDKPHRLLYDLIWCLAEALPASPELRKTFALKPGDPGYVTPPTEKP